MPSIMQHRTKNMGVIWDKNAGILQGFWLKIKYPKIPLYTAPTSCYGHGFNALWAEKLKANDHQRMYTIIFHFQTHNSPYNNHSSRLWSNKLCTSPCTFFIFLPLSLFRSIYFFLPDRCWRFKGINSILDSLKGFCSVWWRYCYHYTCLHHRNNAQSK